MQIMEKFISAGIKVSLNGDKIRLSPSNLVDREMVDFARKHKNYIMQYFQNEKGLTYNEYIRQTECFKKELSKYDEYILVKSKILDEIIIFAGNERKAAEWEKKGYITYLPDEIILIINSSPTPEMLRKINYCKEIFKCRLVFENNDKIN